jgi:hypothetical protein
MPRTLFTILPLTKGQRQTTAEGESVTTSDTADLPSGICVGIAVTGAGNVNINLATGGTAVLTGLSAGQIVPVSASRILTTSTTATGIYALYQPIA